MGVQNKVSSITSSSWDWGEVSRDKAVIIMTGLIGAGKSKLEEQKENEVMQCIHFFH